MGSKLTHSFAVTGCPVPYGTGPFSLPLLRPKTFPPEADPLLADVWGLRRVLRSSTRKLLSEVEVPALRRVCLWMFSVINITHGTRFCQYPLGHKRRKSFHRLSMFIKIKNRPQCAILVVGFFKADFFAVSQIPFVFYGPVPVIHPAGASFFLIGLFPGVFIVDFQPDVTVIVIFSFPQQFSPLIVRLDI